MIVARQPDGRTLLDLDALAVLLGRTVETITRHCTPRPDGLYDAALAEQQLADAPDVVPVTPREVGVRPGTARVWASRGRIRPVGRRGRAQLYDAAELRALALGNPPEQRCLATA